MDAKKGCFGGVKFAIGRLKWTERGKGFKVSIYSGMDDTFKNLGEKI